MSIDLWSMNFNQVREFLAPENLVKNNLPFPESDFNIPGIGECCCEELDVYLMEGNETELIVNCMGDVVAIAQEQITLAEWLGLWLITVAPRTYKQMSNPPIEETELGDIAF